MRRILALTLLYCCQFVIASNLEAKNNDGIDILNDIFPDQTTFYNFTEFEKSGKINIDKTEESDICLHYKFCSQCENWQFCEDENNENCTRGNTSGSVDNPAEGILSVSNNFIGYSFTGKSCSFSIKAYYRENCWETDSKYFLKSI